MGVGGGGKPEDGNGMKNGTGKENSGSSQWFNLVPSESSQVSTGQKRYRRASLVAQWLRICLPMQGTRVRALVWEDPTCRGATGPVSHNY